MSEPEIIEIDVDSVSGEEEETFHTPLKAVTSLLNDPNKQDDSQVDSRSDTRVNGNDDNRSNGKLDQDDDEITSIDDITSPVGVGEETAKSDIYNEVFDDAEAEEFIVEMLTDKEIDKNGNVKYNVKWENYGKSDSTWERVENLVGCDWTLQNYQLTRANWLANKYQHLPSESPANETEPRPSTSSASESTTIISNHHPRKAKNNPLNAIYSSTPKNPRKNVMNGVSARIMKEWKVEEILGITEIENERYFLLRLDKCDKKPFIRASLANRLFPYRVIDFYMKHLRWRTIDPK